MQWHPSLTGELYNAEQRPGEPPPYDFVSCKDYDIFSFFYLLNIPKIWESMLVNTPEGRLDRGGFENFIPLI